MDVRGKRVTLLGEFWERDVDLAEMLTRAGATVNFRFDSSTEIVFVGRGVGHRRDLSPQIGFCVIDEAGLRQTLLNAGGELGTLRAQPVGFAAAPLPTLLTAGWSDDVRTRISSLTNASGWTQTLGLESLSHPSCAVRLASIRGLEANASEDPTVRAAIESRFDPRATFRLDTSGMELLAMASFLGARTRDEYGRTPSLPNHVMDSVVMQAFAFGLDTGPGAGLLRELVLYSQRPQRENGETASDKMSSLAALGYLARPRLDWLDLSSSRALEDASSIGAWLDSIVAGIERFNPRELWFQYVDYSEEHPSRWLTLEIAAEYEKLLAWEDRGDNGAPLPYATEVHARFHSLREDWAVSRFFEWSIVFFALSNALTSRHFRGLAAGSTNGRQVLLGGDDDPTPMGMIGPTGWDLFGGPAARRIARHASLA